MALDLRTRPDSPLEAPPERPAPSTPNAPRERDGNEPRAATEGSHAPTRRDLIAIGLSTFAVRLALFAAATLISGWSLTTFADLHDGASYLRVAGDMLDPSTVVAHFDRRVFIGYPSLIALVGLSGLPLTLAGLLVSWTASAIAAMASAQLFTDRRIGWAMALFPPSFLLFSTLVMSEVTLVALLTLGVYCVVRRNWLLAGALTLGYAGLVRPVACFAVLGVLAMLAYRRRWVRAIMVGGISASVVGLGFLALKLWRGDALEGVKIYAKSKHSFGGELFTWPFESLLTTPSQFSVPLWKVAYVWAYVCFVLGGCFLAVRKLRQLGRSPAADLAIVAAVWLLANTLFVLCMGNKYGFYYFDRHILAALPALLWVYRDHYPRRLSTWVIGGTLSVLLGLSEILASVV